MTRKQVLLVGQWCLSIGLLWYLLVKVDIAQVGTTVSRANPWFVMGGLVQLFAQPVLGALRWTLIARALGGSLNLSQAIRYFWIGAFFNQALPGSVSGDVVRIWLYCRQGATRALSVASVALERFLMLFSLLLLVLMLQPSLVARGASPTVTLITVALLTCGVAGLVILVFSTSLLARYARWLPVRALLHLATAVRRMLSNVGQTALVCSMSGLAYLNMAITVWFFAMGIGLNISLLDCVVLFPIVVLVATLPISIGGWGVRESATITAFALVGVSQPDALAMSILFGLAGLLVTVPGAALWLRGGLRRADVANLPVDETA